MEVAIEKKLVPELRFSGYSDKWFLNREDIKILSGNSYPLDSYKNSGVLLIQGVNIYPGKLITDDPIFIDESFNKIKHIVLKEGDVLIGLNRPIINNKLKVCVFNGRKSYLYQRAGVLKFNTGSIESRFLYQYLRTDLFLKKLSLELVGSDQPYIKSNLFNVSKNYFTSL